MTTKGGRTGHLTLVRRGSSQSAGVVEAVESLSPESLRIAEKLKRETGRSGAIVGVVRGRADWDLRLVLLAQDELRLLRVSGPLTAINKQTTRILDSLRQAKVASGIVDFEFGEFDGRVWVERRYFNETLLQSGERPAGILPSLVELLRELSELGLVHGNIALSNMVFLGGRLKLLDFGFSAWLATSDETAAQHCAPELAKGVATKTTDIFGFGQVAIEMLTGGESASHEAFVRSLTLSDPNARPPLEDLESVWGTKRTLGGGATSGKMASAGRLLSIPASQSAPLLPALNNESVKISPVDNVESAKIPQPVTSANWKAPSIFWPVVGLSALLLLFLVFSGKDAEVNDSEMVDAWRSNQPSMMGAVAKQALRGDRLAQSVIVSDAMKGVVHPLVNGDLIKLGFFPQWEAELSDDDRRILLAFGLSELQELPRLPALNDAHPAVKLAIAAELPLDSSFSSLKNTSARSLGELAGVIGQVFKGYIGTADVPLDDIGIRALSKILIGKSSSKAITAYMGTIDSWGGRLTSLFPIFETQQQLPSQILDAMAGDRTFQRIMLWFQGEPLAGWKTVPDVVKLSVISGVVPDTKAISLESLADLLAFPSQAVRNSAIRVLKNRLGPQVGDGVLGLLAADSSGLSRASIISFVGALQLVGDEREALLASWFDSNPSPEMVSALILAWGNQRDSFPVLAARYLIDKGPNKLSMEILHKMVLHGEALVRAFAYSRLSIDDPEQLRMLQSMAAIEPNQRLRRQLQEKLESVD